MTTASSIGFIGAGTVGSALAVRLKERGYAVVAVASRSRASAERLASRVPGCQVKDKLQEVADTADLVFITTSDDAIGPVCAQLRWRPGQAVCHCSGADSTAVLEPARQAGAAVAGFHPLQTFASVEHAIANIPGSTFALEAEGELYHTLAEMVQALDGHAVRLRAEDKVLYHAAAVIACNYTVTLMKLATDLWKEFGVEDTKEATGALLPLLRGTLNNLENVGLPNCLTGPIARGDLGTIRKHLRDLEARAPQVVSAYREMGLQTVPIALAKGRVDGQRAKEMKELLSA